MGVLVLGTVTFAALGLLLAGTLRSEAVLAAANLAWVLLLVGGGVVVPLVATGVAGTVAAWLPSSALGNASRAAFMSGRLDLVATATLVAWTLLALAALRRWFRWD